MPQTGIEEWVKRFDKQQSEKPLVPRSPSHPSFNENKALLSVTLLLSFAACTGTPHAQVPHHTTTLPTNFFFCSALLLYTRPGKQYPSINNPLLNDTHHSP
jgi:hypothetical protein